jgi:uncharacterized protein YjiS (DUF1127 family)
MATTTQFSHAELGTSAHGLRHVFEVGATRVVALWNAVKNRRSVNQLAGWDDRMLSDIGLTRGDVNSALASGFADDPSYRLSAFSGERKIATRAQVRELRHEWRVDI